MPHLHRAKKLLAAHKTLTPKAQRKQKLQLLFAIILGSLILYSVTSLLGAQHITTDNAYVGADIAQLTASVEGNIKQINVTDTQIVQQGDVLVIIDDIDAILALRRAESTYARAQADLKNVQLEFQRRTSLIKSGSISEEELSTAESNFKIAEATYREAAVIKAIAELNVERTIIRSPIDGTIARRAVQLGQRVHPGNPLLSIVPLKEVYVDANFKEVELRHIKLNQNVILTSDKYGPSVYFKGTVTGLAGGTGAAFAIIPAQNATGNWIKVAQRLPVRITLHPDTLATYPLQVGLSMHADIDTSE